MYCPAIFSGSKRLGVWLGSRKQTLSLAPKLKAERKETEGEEEKWEGEEDIDGKIQTPSVHSAPRYGSRFPVTQVRGTTVTQPVRSGTTCGWAASHQPTVAGRVPGKQAGGVPPRELSSWAKHPWSRAPPWPR